jgi:ArsR family transcriptional regulator, arsenate/arsenite/antimonite-responsive transcriptional repressor
MARRMTKESRREGRAPVRAPLPHDVELAMLAKALAHPARVAILTYLRARGGCVCGDIVDQLPLAQATVSQHLKVMKEAGVLQGEVDGPRVCYCPDPRVLERLKQLVAAL